MIKLPLLNKTVKRILKVIAALLGSLLGLVVLLLFLIRLPAVQNFICDKAVNFVTAKTHTKLSIDRLYIKFPKSVVIEGLYAGDLNNDTLLSLQKLTVDIDMLGLLKKRVELNSVALLNATANIHRGEDSVFNFNFFITAFAPKDTTKAEAPKDTTASPWQIDVGKVKLENIRARFYDEVGGTDIKGVIGALNLDMKKLDIQHLSFKGNELSLANTEVSFVQSKSGGKSADTSIVLMPLLALNKLTVENVKFAYADLNQQFKISAGSLLVRPDTIDLNAHIVKVKQVSLANTQASFTMQKQAADTVVEKMDAEAKAGRGWQISGNELKIDSVDFNFDITGAPAHPGSFDYNHIGLQNVNVDIKDAYYSPDKITADIKNVSVHEQSGFTVKRLTAVGVYDKQHIQLNNLTLITKNTRIGHQLGITYNGFESLKNDLGAMGINAQLSNTSIAVSDIIYFLPDSVAQSSFFAVNRDKTLSLSGSVTGRLGDITASNLEAALTGGTDVALNAHITGLPDAINSYYDVELKSLNTTSNALQDLTGGVLPTAVNIPQTLGLSGTVKGSLKDAAAKITLVTSSGDVEADVKFKMAVGDTQYSGIVKTRALNLGYILKQDTLLGPVTMSATASGRNFSLATMHDSVVAQIQSLGFKKHNYHNIDITATIDSNRYTALLNIKDSALVMDLKAAASFVKNQEYIDATATIRNADLYHMNLMKDDLRASANLQVHTTGNIADMNGTARLGDVVLSKGEDAYRLDSLLVVSSSDSVASKLRLTSDIVSAGYDGNIKLTQLPQVIIAHINSYFTITGDGTLLGADSARTDSAKQGMVKNLLAADTVLSDSANGKFNFAVSIKPHPIITQLLLPKFENFTGASVLGVYDAAEHSMALNAAASSLTYAGIKATDLNVHVNSGRQNLKYDVSLTGLTAGPAKLAETSVTGTIADNNIDFALRIHGQDTLDRLLVSGNLEQDTAKTYLLSLNNDKLIIGNERWQLSKDNSIRFGTAGFAINNFDLNNDLQGLSIKSTDEENGKITAVFKAFQLGSLSQIIETDTPFVRGIVDGSVEFRNTKKAPAFVSALEIKEVRFKDMPVGDIALKADNLTANKYTAQLLLTGFGNDVKVNGSYANTGTANLLDFKVAIKKLNLTTVEPFTFGQIRRSSGYLTGDLAVTGPATQPVIDGSVRFKNAAFNLAYINNYLTLKNEEIAIDKKGVYFRSFNILDSLGNPASIAGAVYTTNFKQMKFDVTINTDNFTVLNTTINDNPLFFGRVLLSSNIKVTGNEQLPVVNAKATLLQGSNVAVVLPSRKISVDRGEGVVVLMDSSEIADEVIAYDTVALATQFLGIKLNARLDINNNTTLKLIVDKTSGDSLVIKGEGRLTFNMNESGNQNLTGTYNINSGAYKATFQKIIKRQLTIQPGGYITFNGSPTDANVDITAVYSVKTSPSDLLASDLAGSTAGEQNTYKKLMTFKVLMHMSGQLLKPDISFKLDMNEADQNAFGGSVYAKVNSLNNDPSELNKQVFALIILGKFIPAGVGSSNGNVYATAATNLARNSLNQVLTDQLNRLSGQYIKFVDLSVGINSNDEYTEAGVNQNTQLSVGLKKSFFKDRLTVGVGTSVNVGNTTGEVKGFDANNLTGDIVVEYKINEDGSLRFKAFRENQYEGLIDGSLYKTGVGIVFARDYDKEKELGPRYTRAERKARRLERKKAKEAQNVKELKEKANPDEPVEQ